VLEYIPEEVSEDVDDGTEDVDDWGTIKPKMG
jgi:hypothetical protein